MGWVLCLGGSATIDGGMGILAALGAAAHDDRGYALPKGGAPLVRLASIDTAQLNIKAGALDYTLLADTRAIPVQAATMYGPQKGAEAAAEHDEQRRILGHAERCSASRRR